MRLLIGLLVALGLGVAAALAAARDPGYLLLYWNGWQVQSQSLWLVLLLLVGVFLLAHWLLNSIGFLRKAPWRLRQRWRSWRQRRAQRALRAGYLAMAEGDWRHARKRLERATADQETALLACLGAARAADEQDDAAHATQYLARAQRAGATGPGEAGEASWAMTLMQAQSLYHRARYTQSLALTQELLRAKPKHPAALQLRMALLERTGQWQELLELLPRIGRQRLLSRKELNRLRLRCYARMLARDEGTAGPGGGDLMARWETIPRRFRWAPEVVRALVDGLHAGGDDAAAAECIERAEARQWQADLVPRYAALKADDPDTLAQRYTMATRWLSRRPDDPGLLLLVARLARARGDAETARKHLEQALNAGLGGATAQVRAQIHRQLGELLLEQGRGQAAARHLAAALALLDENGAEQPATAMVAPGQAHGAEAPPGTPGS